ncbi:phosphatase [Kwoniella mangroviensis CBS 10435]|uniref:Phosphatase n=1 Tax=Kwoniella mangroviensis CBS 10435 TaxID=1331196 RepID=A0A1B9IG68_9TREE|nr:phosphatase [Kwoniella mangroviensis CBS 10435]
MSTEQQYKQASIFTADGVLFDMDGTLTDSIAAVEAAWTAKAEELNLEPEEVIRATHGRRASDNLMELVPGLRKEHVEREVEKFERSILAFADTPPHSRKGSFSSARSRQSSITSGSTRRSSIAPMTPVSNSNTPDIARHPSFQFSTTDTLNLTSLKLSKTSVSEVAVEDESPFADEEAEDLIDMSVRILPGVRKMINSLPEGKYAVATSGAKTYCHGCLNRTGITIPKVCVTADDARLLRGKPFPDPFLLAASDLGIAPTRAVVFEDSPSGIKAGVASGATVIAVCTSHTRDKIENLGAHFVVDTMDQVKVDHMEDGQLRFTVAY